MDARHGLEAGFPPHLLKGRSILSVRRVVFPSRMAPTKTRRIRAATVLFTTLTLAVGFEEACARPLDTRKFLLIVEKRHGQDLGCLNQCVEPKKKYWLGYGSGEFISFRFSSGSAK